MKASVSERPDGFHVEGYEKIEYDFAFVDNVFDSSRRDLADCYEKWGRCLAVMDENMFRLYGEQIHDYFQHYNIDFEVHRTPVGEKAKNIDNFLSIVDSMTKFGIYRKVRHWRVATCSTTQQQANTRCAGACTRSWRRTGH